MRRRYSIIILIFFNAHISIKSQTSAVFLDADSLIQLLPDIKQDTLWLKTAFEISRTLNNINPAEAAKYNSKGFQKAKAIGSKRFMANFSNEAGLSHYFQSELDSALHYFQLGIALYYEIGDSVRAKIIEGNVGLIFIEKGDYKSAIDHYEGLLQTSKENKDSITMSSILGSIGLAYDYMGDYAIAMEHYCEALDLARHINNPHLMQVYLSNIGALHSFLEEDDKAKRYFLEAIPLNIEHENLNELARNYQNLGIIYDYEEKNDSALYYHEKAINIYQETNNKEGIADENLNIGAIHAKLGQLEQAEEYYQKSLVLKKEIGNPERLSSIYIKLGSLYQRKEEFDKAESYLKKAEEIALELGVIQRQKQIYEELGKVYESKGDYYHALDSYLKMKAASDSLLNEAKVRAVADVEEKYKTRERIAENEKLKSEQALNRSQLAKNRITLIGGGVLLALMLISIILITRYSQQQRKFNRLLEDRNKQIQLLNREMNHRVKNNLAFMTGLLEMQGRRLENLDAKEALRESESRLRALSLVHNTLFKSDGKQTLNIKQYLGQMLSNLQSIFEIPGKSLCIKTDIAELELPPEQTMRIGLIVNELVTNSIKHAFAQVDEPQIDLKILQDEEKGLVMQYADNGPGIKEEILEAKKDSLGLKLIGLLVEQLGGRHRFDRNETEFSFAAS